MKVETYFHFLNTGVLNQHTMPVLPVVDHNSNDVVRRL